MALYRDPRDERVFVPQQGGGVRLNFGHPIAWAILFSTTVVPLVIVVLATLAALT